MLPNEKINLIVKTIIRNIKNKFSDLDENYNHFELNRWRLIELNYSTELFNSFQNSGFEHNLSCISEFKINYKLFNEGTDIINLYEEISKDQKAPGYIKLDNFCYYFNEQNSFNYFIWEFGLFDSINAEQKKDTLINKISVDILRTFFLLNVDENSSGYFTLIKRNLNNNNNEILGQTIKIQIEQGETIYEYIKNLKEKVNLILNENIDNINTSFLNFQFTKTENEILDKIESIETIENITNSKIEINEYIDNLLERDLVLLIKTLSFKNNKNIKYIKNIKKHINDNILTNTIISVFNSINIIENENKSKVDYLKIIEKLSSSEIDFVNKNLFVVENEWIKSINKIIEEIYEYDENLIIQNNNLNLTKEQINEFWNSFKNPNIEKLFSEESNINIIYIIVIFFSNHLNNFFINNKSSNNTSWHVANKRKKIILALMQNFLDLNNINDVQFYSSEDEKIEFKKILEDIYSKKEFKKRFLKIKILSYKSFFIFAFYNIFLNEFNFTTYDNFINHIKEELKKFGWNKKTYKKENTIFKKIRKSMIDDLEEKFLELDKENKIFTPENRDQLSSFIYNWILEQYINKR
ncbi:MAG: hypothetical protein ACRCRZ_01290 [Metamycoplasmataceae bacterium]